VEFVNDYYHYSYSDIGDEAVDHVTMSLKPPIQAQMEVEINTQCSDKSHTEIKLETVLIMLRVLLILIPSLITLTQQD
jgi:hypothetical protein